MNTRSIRFRLIVWYAGWLTVVFVCFGLAMYLGLRQILMRNVSDSQARRAEQIGQTLLNGVRRTGEPYVIQEINVRYYPEISDRFIRVTRSDGSVLYRSSPPKDGSFDPALLPAVKATVKERSSRVETLPDDKQLLVVTQPFRAVNGDRFLIEVGAPLAPVQAVLRQLLISLAAGLPVVVLVVVGGGYLLVRRALAPVEKIGRSAEQISLHNLSERLPVPQTGDELERLSESLNHMISRLEVAFRHNRRFMADASHELRTPLTIIRGELESIAQRPGLDSELCETVGSVLEEVERLTRIVESLFALSRLDAGEAQAEWVAFDLAALAASTAEQMCLLAEDKGVTVRSTATQEVTVEGDRARLKQVIVNLLDNAIKYTPGGGKIDLTVTAREGKAALEVTDNGIGIPPEALPHVFERFFRVDKSRSRAMGGAGIGLSIVDAICAAHGGRVEAKSTEGRGSCFRVELPLATAAARNGDH